VNTLIKTLLEAYLYILNLSLKGLDILHQERREENHTNGTLQRQPLPQART
jgi:hypothetical protein